MPGPIFAVENSDLRASKRSDQPHLPSPNSDVERLAGIDERDPKLGILENRVEELLARQRTVLDGQDHILSPERGGLKLHNRTPHAVLEQLEHTLIYGRPFTSALLLSNPLPFIFKSSKRIDRWELSLATGR
jgi:hypothetical protein